MSICVICVLLTYEPQNPLELANSQKDIMKTSTFSWWQAFFVGLGIIPGSYIIAPIFDTFVPIFLQAGNPLWEEGLRAAGHEVPDVMGFALAPTMTYFIMTWDNILSLFIAPWVGARSDRTWNRFGRRKPWMLAGMILMVLGFVLMPFAQSVLAIMAFILVSHLGFAFYYIPANAWWGDLFPSALRSQAGGVFTLMGGIAAIIAFIGSGMLFEEVGRVAPFVIGGLVVALSVAISLYVVKEPPDLLSEDDPSTNNSMIALLKETWQSEDRTLLSLLLVMLLSVTAFSVVQTGVSSFAVFELGMTPGQAASYTAILTVTLTLFAIPSSWIATRFGRPRTVKVGLLTFAAISAAAYFGIQRPFDYALALLGLGIATALLIVNSFPLIYDAGDERHIGLYTGLSAIAGQSASILGPMLAGVAIEWFASQRILFACAAFFQVLAWLVMRRVKGLS